jgi:hypothetical protein
MSATERGALQSVERVCRLDLESHSLRTEIVARSQRPVGILGRKTGGEPERNHRFRTLLPMIEAKNEMRIVFRADRQCRARSPCSAATPAPTSRHTKRTCGC